MSVATCLRYHFFGEESIKAIMTMIMIVMTYSLDFIFFSHWTTLTADARKWMCY